MDFFICIISKGGMHTINKVYERIGFGIHCPQLTIKLRFVADEIGEYLLIALQNNFTPFGCWQLEGKV